MIYRVHCVQYEAFSVNVNSAHVYKCTLHSVRIAVHCTVAVHRSLTSYSERVGGVRNPRLQGALSYCTQCNFPPLYIRMLSYCKHCKGGIALSKS